MTNHIHIMGASGSGTTTLGRELAIRHGYHHVDTDDIYWEPTTPPYKTARPIEKRQQLMREALMHHEKWVLTGSLVGWGDIFIPEFDLVVFLWIPSDLRIARLHNRERGRYGSKIDAGEEMHQTYIKFIDWASQYDTGDTSVRSKKLHEVWMASLDCDLLKLEGKYDLNQKVEAIMLKNKE